MSRVKGTPHRGTGRRSAFSDDDIDGADEHLRDGMLDGSTIAALERWRRRREEELGAPLDACVHEVRWVPSAWGDVKTGVPQRLRGGSCVLSRADVLAVYADPRRSRRDRLTACLVWGFGDTGYGPARAHRILEDTGLEAKLQRAEDALCDAGPGAAYELLRSKDGRIPGLGPAFFTKHLYFADHVARPGAAPDRCRALILDAVVARAVATVCRDALSGADVDRASELAGWLWLGRTDWRGAAPRSRHRYEVYLEAMHRWAAQMDRGLDRRAWAPDLLEWGLFSLQRIRPTTDHGAA